jgi:transcriptional regulator with XRE-family HTH domain
VDMTEADRGPVLSGWLLGTQLEAARVKAGFRNAAEAAKVVSVDRATLKRWENGEVIPDPLKLRGLCGLYGVPEAKQLELEELRTRAKEPGWWSSGKWPDATAELLGMEIAAVRIRSWDLTAIPGLLQTPEYARLVMQSVEPDISPTQLDDGVELRTSRQAKVFEGALREAIIMIDENALARMSGKAAVRRAQLARLRALPKQVTLQVVPFSAGSHPALGSFLICDFDSDRIPAAAFVEGSVSGRSFTEKDVSRYEQVWAWLQEKALTPQQTTEFLRKRLEDTRDDERE